MEKSLKKALEDLGPRSGQLEKALKMALVAIGPGAKTRIAEEIGQTRAAVSQWKIVPLKHIIPVERLSGISRRELRPDMFLYEFHGDKAPLEAAE